MEKIKLYFDRLGLDIPGDIVPDSQLLRELHFAHCTKIPYENLDILRGVPLSMEPEALFQKIVVEGRGGYCFELNGLFGWLLRQLGYKVTDYAARYLRGESAVPMRRHRVLRVEATDGVWCCDVGIGEVCPRYPVRMEPGLEQAQFDECYRFDRDAFLGWVLMDKHDGKWQRFYSFTEEPQLDKDFIALSFYCEKHPDSPFIHQEMFSLKTSQGRITLDGNIYKEFINGAVTVRELGPGEMSGAYQRFGLKMA